jgi:YtkA-like
MRIAILICIVFLLVACAGGITQTSQTERFTIVMAIDGQTVAPRIITMTITDKNGSPATVDSVVVAPVMQEMGMASPEMTATALGNGRYEIKGAPFSMLGIWELNLRISAAGKEDTTSFKVEVR